MLLDASIEAMSWSNSWLEDTDMLFQTSTCICLCHVMVQYLAGR